MKTSFLSFFIALFLAVISYAQKGKNSAYTSSTANVIVNAYTYVTANIPVGASSIQVNSNVLTNSTLATPLAAGDLILIIQMQGAAVNISTGPVDWWGGNYTLSSQAMGDLGNESLYIPNWGELTSYRDAGNYEFAEVLSVSGSNTINLRCPTQKEYEQNIPVAGFEYFNGRIQVVRVPRFTTLTLTNPASIIASQWNGQVGGVVALEVDGTINLQANTRISASGLGFRGGALDNVSSGSGSPTDINKPAYNTNQFGAEKGESIFGNIANEYTHFYSMYGKGSPANGGGGGGHQNAGGGGGSNVGPQAGYTGKGYPAAGYNTYWNLEQAGLATTNSPGGGRGGYSGAQSNQNPNIGVAQSAWQGNFRRVEGGLGGHPLQYDANRIFMGGGGGAGDMDNNQGGAGGNGGGIVFIRAYGAITGSGTIEANGANGQNSNPSGATPSSNGRNGIDAAGGAGGGGSIYISNGTTIPASITLSAVGGNGGNNNITNGIFATQFEADGPGGGGAGGFINFSTGTPTQTVAGGANGVHTATGFSSSIETNFPPNGATRGGPGMSLLTVPYYNLIANNATICTGNTASISVTVQGTLPVSIPSVSWYTTYTGNTVVATGLSYTTPVLTATTTYYVGFCNGSFRVPVTVTVGGPTISGTASITNATCSAGGSITGLSVSGGVTPYTIQWNTVTYPSTTLSNAPAGSYTLSVTDNSGCTATSGPYTINGTGGPTINSTGMVVTNESCLGGGGAISGLSASGTGLTYSWNGGAYSTLNISSLTAGSYSLVVTDNNGCTANLGPINITQNSGPTINTASMVVTGTTCGLSNGSITGITATGTGLTYTWNGVASGSLDQSNLASGNYTLVVTDNIGCTSTQGPINIAASSTPSVNSTSVVVANATCTNGGSVSGLTVSGGQTPYTYNWNSGAYSTLDISNVPAGSYSLVVTDALGCTANAGPFNVGSTPGPTINSTNMLVTNQNCLGTNGSITGLSATGTGLTYVWNAGAYSTLNISGIPAGTYNLTVIDNSGCTATLGPINVTLIAGPSINTASMVVTGTSCGLANGSITGITASGTGLTYTWNGVSSGSLDQSNLASGNYILVVTDNIGCTATQGPINIAASSAPVANSNNVVLTNANCNQSNGAISGITVSGGQTPYTYNWNSGAYATLNISSIPAGSYSLVITDALGCTANAGPFNLTSINGPTINSTSAVITNESCTLNNGSITGITVSGGTPNYTYSWNGTPSAGINLSGVAGGSYTLTVTDQMGCVATAGPFVINSPIPIVINQTNMVVTPTGCVGNTGAISGITVSGGVNPVYTWTPGALSTLDISGLASGNYTLTVSDNQGCLEQIVVNVPSTAGIAINSASVVINNDLCGTGVGSISGLTVSGGTPGYTYVWDGNTALNTIDLSNALGGNHTIVVTDAVGCTSSETLFIGTVAGPTIDQSSVVVVNENCLGNNGSISGILVTGNGPFNYSWTGSSMITLNLSNLQDGAYTLHVTDANGCVSNGTVINVGQDALPNADFTISNTIASPGEVVNFVDASTGGPIQSYTWKVDTAQIGTGTTASYSSEIEGTYTVTLTIVTPLGCIDSVTKTFQIFGELHIPNIITVNSDGVNDEFYIRNLKPNSKLLIVNRWGNPVLNTEDYQNNWNGRDQQGVLLEEGVYFYQLVTPDGKTAQGNVHLLIQ